MPGATFNPVYYSYGQLGLHFEVNSACKAEACIVRFGVSVRLSCLASNTSTGQSLASAAVTPCLPVPAELAGVQINSAYCALTWDPNLSGAVGTLHRNALFADHPQRA